MDRAAIKTVAANLRESLIRVETRERRITGIEEIRDALQKGKSLDHHELVLLFRLVDPLKPAIIDELNRQIAVETAELEALQMDRHGSLK